MFPVEYEVCAMVDDPDVVDFLTQWGLAKGCRMVWGDLASTSDLVAIPCFVIVVDRRALVPGAWESYVDFTKEVNDGRIMIIDGEVIESRDETVCILLDDIDDCPLPRLSAVLRFNDDLPEARLVWLEAALDLALKLEKSRKQGL